MPLSPDLLVASAHIQGHTWPLPAAPRAQRDQPLLRLRLPGPPVAVPVDVRMPPDIEALLRTPAVSPPAAAVQAALARLEAAGADCSPEHVMHGLQAASSDPAMVPQVTGPLLTAAAGGPPAVSGLATAALVALGLAPDPRVRMGGAGGHGAVIVGGWGGAVPADLAPIAAVYQALGYRTATVCRSALEACRAQQLQDLVAFAGAAPPGRPLVFHGYSNNGSMQLADLVPALERTRALQGIVLDSAPLEEYTAECMEGAMEQCQRLLVARAGIAATAPHAQALRRRIPPFLSAHSGLLDYSPRIRQLRERPSDCPYLFLYGLADHLVPAAAVEAFVGGLHAVNPRISAERVTFAASPHCQHYRLHARRYEASLVAFLRRLGPMR